MWKLPQLGLKELNSVVVLGILPRRETGWEAGPGCGGWNSDVIRNFINNKVILSIKADPRGPVTALGCFRQIRIRWPQAGKGSLLLSQVPPAWKALCRGHFPEIFIHSFIHSFGPLLAHWGHLMQGT